MSISEFRYPLIGIETNSLANKTGGFTAHYLSAHNARKSSHLLEEWENPLYWFDWCENDLSLGWRRFRASHGPTVASRVCESCCVCLICLDLLWSLPGGLCVAGNAMTGEIIPLLLETSPSFSPTRYDWSQHSRVLFKTTLCDLEGKKIVCLRYLGCFKLWNQLEWSLRLKPSMLLLISRDGWAPALPTNQFIQMPSKHAFKHESDTKTFH